MRPHPDADVLRLRIFHQHRNIDGRDERQVDQVLGMQAADGQLVIIILIAGLEAARNQRKGAGVFGEAELGGFVENAEFL